MEREPVGDQTHIHGPLRRAKNPPKPGTIQHVTLEERENPDGRQLCMNARGDRVYDQPGGGVLLRGWKPISLDLGVGPESAKRYHNDWGMPVIRFTHRKGVWTTSGAIDTWIIELSKLQNKKIKAWNERHPDLDSRRVSTNYKMRTD